MPTGKTAVGSNSSVDGTEQVIQGPARQPFDAPDRSGDAGFRTLDAMRLLEAFATAFINTFGITQPTDEQRRRAAWFILVMLLLTVAVVAVVGYAFYTAMHR